MYSFLSRGSSVLFRSAAVIASSILLLGGFTAISPRAEALSSNCSASLQSIVGATRAQGSCRSIGSDTKVRVTMDLTNGPDYHSVWFTTTNKTYVTPYYYTSPQSSVWPRSARTDQARR